MIGSAPEELAAYWRGELAGNGAPVSTGDLFAAFQAPFDATVDAIVAMLPASTTGAAPDA